MSESNIVKCPSCGEKTDEGNMTSYHGTYQCEGCAEGMARDPKDDPTGRGWTNDCAYSTY